MHEMAVTRSMLDIVLEEAKKANASKVTEISIVLGEMSTLVDHCIQFNFDYLSIGTAAEGAKLNFRNVPKQARCLDCGNVFQPDGILWTCDKCQSSSLKLISGDELYIESIEVE